MKTNIVQFAEPDSPSPGLTEYINQAQDAVNAAFHACCDQIEAVKLAAKFEKDGDRQRAADVRRVIDRKAAGIVGSFLEAVVGLRQLQVAALQWLDTGTEQLKTVDRSLLHAAGALVVWDAEKPAADLIDPCRALVKGVSTVSIPFPTPAGLEEITTAAFDGSDMRARARFHGANLQFLQHAAALLLLLPW